MNWNFPKAKFVDENDRDKQFEHVVSEVVEVSQALDNHEPPTRVDEELMDLTHSLETYWRVLEKERGVEYVRLLRKWIFEKNAARGYYPALPAFVAEPVQ